MLNTPPHLLGAQAPSTNQRHTLTDDDRAKVTSILSRKVKVIDHAAFRKPDAEARVFDASVMLPIPDVSWYLPWLNARDRIAGSESVVRGVTLSAEHEVAYFLRFNYARHRLAQLHGTLREEPDDERSAALLDWHDRAIELRNTLICFNLALVPHVLTESIRHPDKYGFIGDGNLALIRAVLNYDVSKGCRFYRYAFRCIRKGVLRPLLRIQKSREENATDGPDPVCLDAPDRAKANDPSETASEAETMVRLQKAVRTNVAGLTRRERAVVRRSYGIGRDGQTLEAIGSRFGLTKQRVQQIRAGALAKLRRYLEDTRVSAMN